MKTTITLKEFSDLSPVAVQVTHAAAPANADSQPQPTTESVNGFHVPADKSDESSRELLHHRYNAPLVSLNSYHRWGINE